MERYEIMLVVSPELEKEEHEEVLGGLASEIEKGNGSVDIILDWRRRRLAYEINKLQEGHYYLVYFTAQGSIVPELEHYFKVTDSIMRYMIVRATEQEFAAAVEKAEREAAKAREESEKKAAEEIAESETEVEETAEIEDDAALESSATDEVDAVNAQNDLAKEITEAEETEDVVEDEPVNEDK